MKHLSTPQLAELKKALETKLSKLTQYHQAVMDESPALDAERAVSNESGEDAQEAYEFLATDALGDETGKMVIEVQAALERMKTGTYGMDEENGQPIPYLRLKLYPEARTNPRDTESNEAV